VCVAHKVIRMTTLHTVDAVRRFSPAPPPPNHNPSKERDELFVLMLDAFRRTGGLAPIAEVTLQLQRQSARNGLVLAEWIARGDLICFEWQARRWIPWFQFNRHDMAPHPQLSPVLEELGALYDAWEMAVWFATPNPWLAGSLPVNALGLGVSEVLHAARADRFIANG